MEHNYSPQNIERISDWLKTGSINLFGMPFAGKDTQGRILADMFDGPLLGGGDILRGSVIPDEVRAIMHRGELIPTEDYLNIVLPYLSQEAFIGKPLVLSSVGRWHGEETGVIEATAAAEHPLKLVFFLNLPEDVVWERWHAEHDKRSQGDRGDRADDTPEALEVRLREFEAKTTAVIDFYKQTDLFVEIDANRPAPEVTAHILDAMLARANS